MVLVNSSVTSAILFLFFSLLVNELSIQKNLNFGICFLDLCAVCEIASV